VDLGLKDKVVLITGSGSGIGREMALSFAKEGAKIGVNDVSDKAIGETIDLVKAAKGEAFSAKCDITDLGAVKDLVAGIEKSHGRIDALVNNAAVLIAHDPFVETNPADCEKEIKVALFGTLNCVRSVLPGMIARTSGKIVNIVTDAARAGQERQVNYSAAKGGVISFTKSIATEVGRHNINVNAVSPGATNSPMRRAMLAEMVAKVGEQKMLEREEKVKRAYPLRRIGEPQDIANMVMFLCSDTARHITGQIISVNGGFVRPG
jgi:2-hydroxycyclohexanecarboxyl-CoA dehydrogenase